jgi:hypothetical protein
MNRATEAPEVETPEVDANIEMIRAWWADFIPQLPAPNGAQFERWATIHQDDLTRMRRAIMATAERLRRRPFNDPEHPLKFISSVANSLRPIQEKAA